MLRTFSILVLSLALVACDDGDDPTDAGCTTCGTDSGPSTGTDAGPTGTDAGPDDMDAGGGTDAGPDETDAGPVADDAGGVLGADAMVGTDCFSNFDCAADQVCVCGSDSCDCQTGTRGTSATGVACTENEDCGSGLCQENNGVTACTAPCETVGTDATDCAGLFPDCADVPFYGRVCVDEDS